MNVRMLTGAIVISAALLNAQTEPKQAPDEARQGAVDQATKEAQRQGQVALKPNATQSPTQTVQQAIAFERYKDMAAEREAQKEAGATARNTESRLKPKHTMAVAKPKR